MRTALFGGTFDPIHRGHLRLAAAAAQAFALDRVLFAPTGRQPLKSAPPEASFADRLAMVTLALSGLPATPCAFLPSGLDAPHPGGAPNYTVDLLTTLRAQLPKDQFFVLTGADSFLTLPHWREPHTLLALAQWIVASRPGYPLDASFLESPQFAPLNLTPAERARIHLLPALHEDVSSTELRNHLHSSSAAHGEDDLIPAAVTGYIRTHALYR
jgi:nicotinate-nucleotide adenylyltransferase